MNPEIDKLMAPLFERAEREGLWFYTSYQDLWFYTSYQDLWFSPEELRKAQREGRFRWGPGNWQLRAPEEYLRDREQTLEAAQARLEAAKARVEKSRRGSS
jgi:hypothetical protein